MDDREAEAERLGGWFPVASFGDVVVHVNNVVSTPLGDVDVSQVRVHRGQPRYETFKSTDWGQVAVAIIVALFTCGLGLIILFFSGRSNTVQYDTVIVDAPDFQHVAVGDPGQDADAFIAWLTTWQRGAA